MHCIRSIRRLALGAAVAGAAIGAVPAIASAASACTYNPSTRTATVTVDDSGANSLVIKNGGSLINVDSNQLCVSSGFEFASVTNTDRLEVNAFVSHSRDGVTIDESTGEFAPGFTSEADGHSELEIVVRKAGGVSSSGETTIIGTPGSDVIRIGRGSVSLQSALQAGKDLDDDTDLVLPPGVINVLGGNGADFLSGQGYGGRLPTLSPLDLEGGAGDDTLFGGTQGDHLFGEGDNDTLRSVDQATDFVLGGAGFDNAIHDARDVVSQVESAATSSVGRLALAPRSVRADSANRARMKLTWTHPKAWRELREVSVRLSLGAKQVGTINVRPSGERLSASGRVRIMANGSRVTHRGKTVTARLAMRFPRSLAGEVLRVAVQATDREGHEQLEPDAGVLRLAK